MHVENKFTKSGIGTNDVLRVCKANIFCRNGVENRWPKQYRLLL